MRTTTLRRRLVSACALFWIGALWTPVLLGAQAPASSPEQAFAAIEAMRVAVEALSPETAPQAWAGAQNRLGGALYDMAWNFEGAERRNLFGQAIEAFRAAITVLDRERDPEDWTIVRYNLANALLDDADLADKVEARLRRNEAVGLLEAAEVWVPESYASLRATIAGRLGDAYASLAAAGIPSAFKSAADGYQRALVRLPLEAAGQRALVEHRLGLVLCARARVDDQDASHRLEALAAFERAAKAADAKSSPVFWATLQRDRADCRLEHAMTFQGERAAAELKAAVQGYEIALATFTREADAAVWRGLQNNLGAALLRLAQSSETGAADYLLRAGQTFGELATVIDRAAEPEAWAQLQHNLGLTYRLLGRAQGASAAELATATQFFESAIRYLRASLEVFTRQRHPQAWAESQSSLAIALQDLARLKEPADAAVLIDEASALLREAREVLEAPPPSGRP